MAEKRKSLLWLIIAVVAVVVIWWMIKGTKGTSSSSSAVSALGGKGTYQVVFLDTDQAYVGKIKEEGEYIRVNDAFRLLVDQGTDADKQTNIQLVRIDESFHGPTDSLLINRDHVTLLQELRADSKLLETIKNYQPATKK
ncbi:MAG: hypothetical protein WAP74_01340 [Patescibacteria group bacterium]